MSIGILIGSLLSRAVAALERIYWELVNMTLRPKRMRLFDGRIVRVAIDDQGRGLCPVCGMPQPGGPPYLAWIASATAEFDRKTKFPARLELPSDQRLPLCSGSHNICPRCSTQFGDTDFLEPSDGLSQDEMWEQVRRRWREEHFVNPEQEHDLEKLERFEKDNSPR